MSDDPFSILGLAPSFEISAAEVGRAYLARAARLHPDVVGDDSDGTDQAARLNQAKEVLLHSEARALALLTLIGGPAKDSDKTLPEGFLMEFMEVRASAEAASASGDHAECAKWRAWAMGRRRECEEQVALLFRAVLRQPDSATLKELRIQLNAWRYIERMIEQLEPHSGNNSGVP